MTCPRFYAAGRRAGKWTGTVWDNNCGLLADLQLRQCALQLGNPRIRDLGVRHDEKPQFRQSPQVRQSLVRHLRPFEVEPLQCEQIFQMFKSPITDLRAIKPEVIQAGHCRELQ